MPLADKFLSRRFSRPNLESQVVEIAKENPQIKEESVHTNELLIEKKEAQKAKNHTTQKAKKRTATNIHLEIKQIINDNPDLEGHQKARSVLDKAYSDGFKGKRLAQWEVYLDDYFNDIMKTEVVMASSARNMWAKKESKSEQEKALDEEVEKKNLQESTNESTITEQKKENKIMSVDIPDLPLDELEEAAATESEDTSVQDEAGGALTWGVIGAGQAGGRLAESLYRLGYKKCLAVNTAEHDLDGLKDLSEIQKVVMDAGAGGGAGKSMLKGQDAAVKHQQEIYEKLQKLFGPVDRILVCAGGGGGTGGGSCLTLVQTAKKYLTYLGVADVGSKVGVLLTLPRAGEAASPTIAKNAFDLTKELCQYAEDGDLSPLIIFDNDKIDKLYPKLSPRRYWDTVNATVTGLFHMFNVLASKPGLESFDTADYGRVLSAGGCVIMGMTNVKEFSDGTHISKAIRQNLEKGLLCGGFDISTAKAVASLATASPAILDTAGLMQSLQQGFDTLANITGNATVFPGIYEVEKDKLVVYTMLTGLARPQKRLDDLFRFHNQNK